MWPRPEASSAGSRARVICMRPSTLTSHIQRQLSLRAAASGSRPRAPPALLTSTSSWSIPAPRAGSSGRLRDDPTAAVPAGPRGGRRGRGTRTPGPASSWGHRMLSFSSDTSPVQEGPMQVPFRRPAGALLGLALLTAPAPGKAASPPAAAAAGSDAWLDSTSARWNEISEKIWGFSETALQETKSSALLLDVLEKEGFSVTRGVAGMPTAFVASAGAGAPVVGILAEYDALPGLSQAGGVSKKTPLAEGAPGHGCGHNL